ncbi:MAG: Lrp/AsnC family transcriptional regulator, partial [Candidatus Diapherotrites archaeon]|nr:Lrp/AsnC family transcriptional regulator [Candidatus Diapherotrites archaeon]
LKVQSWIFLSMNSPSKNPEKLFDELFKFNEVYGIFVITGSDDLALKIFTYDIAGATNFILHLENTYKNIIKSSSLSFATKRYKTHHVILDPENVENGLNKTDFELLKILKDNPNLSIKEISSQLGVHRNTVSTRIQKLFDEKIILKKSTRVSPEYYDDIGISFRAIMKIDAKTGEIDKLAKKLADLDEIHELVTINAKHDILAIVRTKTIEDYYNLSRKLHSDPEFTELVDDTNSSVILKGRTESPKFLDQIFQTEPKKI